MKKTCQILLSIFIVFVLTLIGCLYLQNLQKKDIKKLPSYEKGKPRVDIPVNMAGKTANGNPPQLVEISITKEGFRPADITIETGDLARWTNNDNEDHQIQGLEGKWASRVLKNSETFIQEFDVDDVYEYFDKFNPSLKARVVVEK